MLSNSLKRPRSDRWLVILYFILVANGLVMIHSVGAPPEGYTQDLAGMITTPVGKQAIWLGISFGIWFAINYVSSHRFWIVSAYPIYISTIVLLVLVLLIGKEINGARSWFSLAGFTFQPSELAKFGTCLAVAAYLSQWNGRLQGWKTIAGCVLLWAIPAIVIMGQPDAGSALVFTSFLLVMYREGLTATVYILGGFTATMFILGILYPPLLLVCLLLAVLLVILALSSEKRKLAWTVGTLLLAGTGVYLYQFHFGWPVVAAMLIIFLAGTTYHLIRQRQRLATFTLSALVLGAGLVFVSNYTFNNVLRPHHQDRINVWLQPDKMDPRGALYNVLQSKLAISAGGGWGRGYQQGTMTRFDYVPEQLTDFIFTAVGEEQGFLGTSLIILCFLGLLWRISIIAERQRMPFARAYAYGFAGIILIHILVNIGMTMGLMPVIGIPLPFMSKGGSSLLSFTIMMAVLLKLDKHRAEV